MRSTSQRPAPRAAVTNRVVFPEPLGDPCPTLGDPLLHRAAVRRPVAVVRVTGLTPRPSAASRSEIGSTSSRTRPPELLVDQLVDNSRSTARTRTGTAAD